MAMGVQKYGNGAVVFNCVDGIKKQSKESGEDLHHGEIKKTSFETKTGIHSNK